VIVSTRSSLGPIAVKMPNRPIRIALVITELEVGGAERCLCELACRLDPQRFQPTVYSLGPRPTVAEDLLVRRLEASHVPTHFLGVRRPWQVFQAIGRLQQHFARSTPDIVQSFLFHANVVAAQAARRCGVTSICTGLRVAERGAWRWWLMRRIAPCVTQHVCVSQAVAAEARWRGKWPLERVTVIPNGIDGSLYPAKSPADLAPLGVPEHGRAITLVGRLERQKGVDWLLDLMPTVFDELPNCHLLIIGAGPQRLRLQRMTNSLRIADRVHFLGKRADVPEILRASHLLVLPSRWEGMPNVLLEGMASGLPVVATDVEGVAELLGPRAAEQVVPRGNAEAFAGRVIRIGKDDRLAERLGKENRQHARANWSFERMIAQYERLYESLFAAEG
jgi:glycosyltransferase involved in cell wall biosynthesis